MCVGVVLRGKELSVEWETELKEKRTKRITQRTQAAIGYCTKNVRKNFLFLMDDGRMMVLMLTIYFGRT